MYSAPQAVVSGIPRPAAILKGEQACLGASERAETIVAVRHHSTKHYLMAGKDCRLRTHPVFNSALHRHRSGRHDGHCCEGLSDDQEVSLR